MPLLLEISDDQARRIQSATGNPGCDAIADFVAQAIEAHLQQMKATSEGQCDNGGLTAIIEQVRDLRHGQRAIAAMVDSTATVLAGILRTRRDGASQQ